jgi:hypothetical protein
MTALYKIANEYQALFDLLDEDDQVLEKLHVIEKLDQVKDVLENKAIAIASYIKNLDAELNAVDAAKKEMAARAERVNNKMDFLKRYLKENMELCGITEISRSPHFVIKLKKCPESVEVYAEDQIPDEYRKVKTSISIDKVKIKEEIHLGVIVPGATLKQNLRVEIK